MANDNTDAPTAVAATTEKKKGKASERIYLAADGTEAESPLDCVGFTYKSAGEKRDTNPTDWAFTVNFADIDEKVKNGLAAFGGLTLAGNQTNRVRNGQVKDDGPQTEEDAVTQWWENILAGNWVTEGGRVEAGLELLAEAHLRILHADGVTEHNGVTVDLDYVKERHKSKTKAERAVMRKDARFENEMNKIRLERSTAKLAEGGAQSAIAL